MQTPFFSVFTEDKSEIVFGNIGEVKQPNSMHITYETGCLQYHVLCSEL
jgi:hypothetical protein